MSTQDYEADESSERWRANPDDMRIRRSLAKRVGGSLSRNEQETSIHFFGDSDRFEITTYRPSVVKRILKHEFAAVDWVYEDPEKTHGGRVDFPPEVSPDDLVEIEGVSASLPIGTLSIKGVPRGRDVQSQIVSTPEEARSAAEAFRGGEDE
jgi:hypothetical protein